MPCAALFQTFSSGFLSVLVIIFISLLLKKPNGCMKSKTVNIWCSDKGLNGAGDSPERRRKKILPLWACAADHPSRARRKTERIHSSLHYVMLTALLTMVFLYSTCVTQMLFYSINTKRIESFSSGELWFVRFMGNSSVHIGLKWILMEMSRLF